MLWRYVCYLLLTVFAVPCCCFDLFLDENLMASDTVTGNDNSSDSASLQEWAPVSASLVKGQKSYFEFSINNTDSFSQLLQTYEMFIFLSANICERPSKVDNDTSLVLYYTFNSNDTGTFTTAKSSTFDDGYLEALALRPYYTDDSSLNNGTYSTLYLMVQLVNSTTGQPFESDGSTIADDDERWSYQISISQRDLVFQWDKRPWLDVVDTDYNSALLVTGNVTAMSKTTSNYSIYDVSLYDIYIYGFEYAEYFDNLNLSHSLCAIQNGPYLISSANGSLNGTNNGNTAENASLSSTTLSVHKSITVRGGSAKEQFHITGLNSSTTYVAYVTKKLATSTKELEDSGGVLFSKQLFETMDDSSCSLIFGLGFCDGVAYSVPSSSLLEYNDKDELAAIYDSIAESYYSNFSLALQLIPCDTEQDAVYSPLRKCSNCAASYKNWLCSVSIPRCTTDKTKYYVHRSAEESRNEMLNELIKPSSDYYEILPCVDTCVAMLRDCPPDFGFTCPSYTSYTDLMLNSYNFYETDQSYLTCNFVGNSADLQIEDPSEKDD
ncbi:Mid1p [Kluyveromyces lactis]|uniref:KLLA0E13179p n=1 Tax=Kluyveromyces lactis (strain ATCC 8585 / CBS 2359 / DSM 70799 / NBRC 1267 / NRRL Y-1140 / WM37) TaxID=284590 RepID=Q6CNE5_KLULA|nr:uncharacterized protein KLLA0_E13179g [Kluyveromyces lactis]CAG99631.1 KLLA0E13179p [Kluyveromyces lactis]|eukprot:XP_454544.1 uncharacterized protein KLLA0_E13179g [Kluyveromyces lactis]